jgi:hypothetical protein
MISAVNRPQQLSGNKIFEVNSYFIKKLSHSSAISKNRLNYIAKADSEKSQ